ncbi:Serine [Trichuris trichiura]|uniref:Serine n=1 Tax=Trichuris trichiura TaxID=36087 RepID=A0A077YXT6_TRITR|nr:Serine [Trichuris trichiura]
MSISDLFRFEFPTAEDYELLENVLRRSGEQSIPGLDDQEVKCLRARYCFDKLENCEVIFAVRTKKPLLMEHMATRMLANEVERNGLKCLADYVKNLRESYHCLPKPFVASFLADTLSNCYEKMPSPPDSPWGAVAYRKQDKDFCSPVLLVDFKMQLAVAIAIPSDKINTTEVEDDEALFIIDEVLEKSYFGGNVRKNNLVPWKRSECIDGYWATPDDVKKSLVYIREYLQVVFPLIQ